jgi:Holliday junction resolvasome RuvABC endonuclease subunit
MGFGLIRVINKKKWSFCNSMNCSYPNTINHYQKLKLILSASIELIDTHNPDVEVAIEAPLGKMCS